MIRTVWLSVFLVGCSGQTDETDQDSDSDTEVVVIPNDMPDDPRPLSVVLHGALEQTLLFDTPTCTLQAANFRTFWRIADHSHVFVLIAESLGHYEGTGTLDSTLSNTRVKLLEEAGGSGYAFATDTTQGDSMSLTVDHVDDIDNLDDGTRVWGSFTVGGLHGEEGALTLDPTTIPIWCPDIN